PEHFVAAPLLCDGFICRALARQWLYDLPGRREHFEPALSLYFDSACSAAHQPCTTNPGARRHPLRFSCPKIRCAECVQSELRLKLSRRANDKPGELLQ